MKKLIRTSLILAVELFTPAIQANETVDVKTAETYPIPSREELIKFNRSLGLNLQKIYSDFTRNF